MRLAGRIPVEPLDEDRVVQIERAVVAGAASAAARGAAAGQTRRTLGRAAFALALAAAGLVGWMLHRASPVATDAAVVRVESVAQRQRLDIGDARITSEPGTAFAVTRPDGGVLVAMARGVVELEVGKRGERPPLVVRAGDTDVIVVGTRFTVDAGDGKGDVAVRVSEGVVRVVHGGHEIRLAAGEHWQNRDILASAFAPVPRGANGTPDRTAQGASAGSNGASAPPATAAADRLDSHAGAAGDAEPGAPEPRAPGDRAERPAPSANADPHASSDSAEPRAPSANADPRIAGAPDAPGGLHDRTAAVPETGAPRNRIAQTPDVLRDRTAAVPGASRDRAHDPSQRRAASDTRVELAAAIRSQPVAPAVDLGGGDAPTRAIERYYDIAAHRSGDEASSAFYSIAVVEHLRLARNADALRALDAYVRRFPRGKEHAAALWLRVRILCLSQFDDRCRAAAYTYLHEAPDGPTTSVAERITQTE